MRPLTLIALVILAGCASRPTASQVCQDLAAKKLVTGCAESPPNGLGAKARDHVDFMIGDKKGQAFSFASDDDYKATSQSFNSAGALVGPHRYGNEAKRVYVQLNDKTDAKAAAAIKSAVDAL